MTTESAKIIIDAEDLASKKFEQAARAAEKNIKAIKDTGAKAKASTEFFGQLANTLGGTQLAGYAGQMAGLTEKVSQFSDVSKLGTAGALAFKAGLLGVVAVVTYQVATAIASLVYDIAGLERQMKKTADANIDSLNKLSSARERVFSERIEDVDLLAQLQGSGADPAEERRKVQSELRAEIAKTNAEIKKATEGIEAYQKQWTGSKTDTLFFELEKERIAAMKSSIAQMESMEQKLRSELSARAQNNEAIRKQIDAQKELEAEKQKAIDEANRDKERVADLLQKETDRITEQRIELEKGKEAARAFALEKQGLTSADAKRLAAEQAAIDALRENKAKASGGADSAQQGLHALQSRLLTRGPVQKLAEKQVKVLEQIRDKLPLTSSPSQKLQLEVVG